MRVQISSRPSGAATSRLPAHRRTRAHRTTAVAFAVAGAFALAACGDDDDPGSGASTQPATRGSGGMTHGTGARDCPAAPKAAGAPKRVVTMDAAAAAIVGRLGLADRVVGTGATDFLADFDGAERERLDRIEVLNDRAPSREQVIAARPDLVMGISTYEFGGFDGTATPQQIAAAGADVLVACDTSRGVTTGLDATYAFLRQTGEVFGVPERGAALASEVRREVERVRRQTAGREPVRVMTLSSNPSTGRSISTSGGSSLANGIIRLAGGRNIAEDVRRDFAMLSPEQVAQRDPEVIVVVTGFSPQPVDELERAIRSSPLLASTSAVRERRFVVVPQTTLLSPSVLNGETVATLATAFEAPATPR